MKREHLSGGAEGIRRKFDSSMHSVSNLSLGGSPQMRNASRPRCIARIPADEEPPTPTKSGERRLEKPET